MSNIFVQCPFNRYILWYSQITMSSIVSVYLVQQRIINIFLKITSDFSLFLLLLSFKNVFSLTFSYIRISEDSWGHLHHLFSHWVALTFFRLGPQEFFYWDSFLNVLSPMKFVRWNALSHLSHFLNDWNNCVGKNQKRVSGISENYQIL